MIDVFVQAVRGRSSWETTQASIEASDIGERYVVSYQGERTTPRQHFLHLMATMAESKSPWVLRLEDDVLVNRHILENIKTWKAKNEKDFGAGWLFDAGGTTRTTHDKIYQRLGKDRWHGGQLHCCQGVLLRTEDIGRLRSICAQWFEANLGELGQDIALSRAVAVLGRRICVHAPPLVEHQIQFRSTLGHANTRSHTTEGAFQLEWQRPG